MRIFLVSRGTPSEKDPQWGSFELDQAKALKEYGHEVIILSLDRRFRFYWRHIGTTCRTICDIPVYNAFYVPDALLGVLGQNIKKRIFNCLFDRLLCSVISNHGAPDIMYCHYLPNIELGVCSKQKHNIPVVGIEHWSKVGQKNLDKTICETAKFAYSQCNALIAVSSDLQSLIKTNLDIDSYVVNNMLGSGFTYSEKSSDGKLNFVSVGNLLPIKGFNYLIEAFSMINVSKDKWSLKILGGGSEKDNLQKQIDSLGLTDNVKLLGRKQKDEVIKHLHESNVFVVSSLTETFGVAAIEAMACGLPVISTKCGGPNDFLTDENGIFCEVANPQSLASAILYMIDNYKKYDCKKISTSTKERFSQSSIAKQLTEIFENVIKKKK